MQLKDIHTRVSDTGAASKYGWSCWPDAYMIDFQTAALEISVVYNIHSGLVYEVTASEKPECDNCVRYRAPEWIDAQEAEARMRGVNNDYAYDQVRWVNMQYGNTMLSMIDESIESAPPPENDTITIRVSDEVFMQLARLAHENDITITALCSDLILTELVKRKQ